MQVNMLLLDAIAVGERLRTVDPDWVQGLQLSIGQIGLQTPITVGPANGKGQHKLISGAHRLAACRALGHTSIAAVVCRLTALEQRLVEIDENLCRRDLSALDRAAHLSERKAVYEAVHPNTKWGRKGLTEMFKINGLSPNGNNFRLDDDAPAFSDVAAEKMGFTPRHIRGFVRLWDRLVPDVRAPLSTSLYADKFSELSLLSRQTPTLQRRIVTALLRHGAPARSVKAALAEIQGTPAPLKAPEAKLQALKRVWHRSGDATKREFLEEIEADLCRLLGDRLLPARRPEPVAPTPETEGGADV